MDKVMTAHEIRPKQLRALLLLLVLVPLIPAAMMIRFMLDTIHVEQLAALDRLQQLHGETLRTAVRNTEVNPGQSVETRAQNLFQAIDALAGASVTARIIDVSGTLIAGTPEPWGQIIAQTTTPALPDAVVQLHLAGPQVLDDAISGQRTILIWTSAITILSVLLITGLAASTLHRQIAIRELKSTSVATVAHELRTPLASMRMLVDTLREGRYRGEQQLREYLDLVATENERLSRLAESFLTFSRLDRRSTPLALAPISVEAVVERSVTPLRARLQTPDCEFHSTIAPGLPQIMGELDSLSQVLTNLLDNALKYSEPPARIRLEVSAAGRHVKFAVSDQGIGIPAEERKTIFTPFYQVDRKLSRRREGCGLGLAIAREIVQGHHGAIEVASTPGKGSVFSILIPTA